MMFGYVHVEHAARPHEPSPKGQLPTFVDDGFARDRARVYDRVGLLASFSGCQTRSLGNQNELQLMEQKPAANWKAAITLCQGVVADDG